MSDFDQFNGNRTSAAIAVGQEVLNVVVEHREFRRIFESAVNLVNLLQSLKMPSGIIIQADSGMGKTLLLLMIKRALSEAGEEGSEAPCLEIQLDSVVDPHKFAGLTMLALGYPMLPTRPNLQNMNFLIDKAMTRLKPRVILIDEMQHICEGNRDITASATADWLKVRMDRFNLPVIGVGTRTLERLSVISPQFVSRASVSFVLSPFEYGDAWRQLLGAFASAVHSVDMVIIRDQMARAIHSATLGNLRSLKRLLTYAAMYAAETADKKVNLDALARAYDDTNGHAIGRANPFRALRPAA